MKATTELCAYCFATLEHFLCQSPEPAKTDIPKVKSPLFVTWNKAKSANDPKKALRGCIGNFGDLNLQTGLGEYALISASKDHRFDPINKSEIPSLMVTVTLLSDFEDAKDWQDWTVGTHGVTITFTNPNTGNPAHATFLPEVASEHGWNKEQTMRQLIYKAGYNANCPIEFFDQLRLERYQGVPCSLHYSDYLKLKHE
eukprot:TRINITY_DN27951_c0_g1_i1.p1 TRINITY_DN27951_c0_g1~~TRINITY_DN27951_c0_g1_i1.p1  ORF type:complete len:199 (+),score=35.44 TRINITY_DN27951_c0_g1_i1:163-759(+)